MLSFVVFWDPAREMFPFSLPFLGRPILWYGFFFALGFGIGYLLFLRTLRRYCLARAVFAQAKSFQKSTKEYAERLLFSVMVGAIIGARLFDVLFYQDVEAVLHDPLSILRIWEGGLASHGGALGAMIGMVFFFYRHKAIVPTLCFLSLLDLVCIPAAVIAGCIRIGNFFNQEILGTCTAFPFAVIFGHPADGGEVCPRHPVQLYEALFYFAVISVLKRQKNSFPGKTFSWFLLLVFGFRLGIESIKVEQSALFSSDSIVTMGQMLSLPFLLLGAGVLLWQKRKDKLRIKRK
ncbi:MAG: prolipoprotein diacylglyceryl transferase [Chlamydiae bacterium]|nr:prolipoprotein diacylglyceryl transferase [Chlamydiota bacterium]